MKFNWGTGIALFYLIFVASLIFQVFKSRQYDHSLVVDNYYEADLKYQEHYDKLKNGLQLTEAPKIQFDSEAEMLRIEFPAQEAAGTILFFRPSSSKEDQLVQVKLDANNIQYIPTDKLSKGLWRVKINWQLEGVEWYHEDSVVI